MSKERHGGCLCGAIRYRITHVLDAGFCHCASCKKLGGSAFSTWARVDTAGFALTAGEPASFRASTHGLRNFCGRCGAHLYFADDQGRYLSVAIGTLDAPETVQPRIHLCVESHLPWLKMNDGLPWVEGATPPAPDQRKRARGPADAAVTRESTVSLRAITAANVAAILGLDVGGPQRRFVAPNAVSLAQGVFHELSRPPWFRGIYAGNTAVGFVMLNVEEEDYQDLPLAGEPFLWRFMIDERYQELGLGRRALDLVIAEVGTWGAPRALWVSVVHGTGSPHGFYARNGFVDTGVCVDGEWILRRDL